MFKIRKFVKRIIKQRRVIFAALLVFVVILILWTVYLWWRLFVYQPSAKDAPASEESASSACRDEACLVSTTGTIRRPIDGLMVPAEQASSSLFAVMLDNFPEARPAAGLSQALLVWEAPVEGGMTRFLAVFATSTELSRVGPVRSARPYYLDWTKELNALYLHCGGSPQALTEINSKDIFDLNEFYRGWYFWRDRSRARPYNVYTSTSLVGQAFAEQAKRHGWQLRTLDGWLFKEEAELKDRGEAVGPSLNFGKVSVEWKYNRADNFYERWEDGAKQKDESGTVIIAKNVVIQYTSVVILDEVGRRQIKTVGSGKAMIYRDGREIVGTWQKQSLTSRTRFFGPDTKEIEFNAGTTWIEVTSP